MRSLFVGALCLAGLAAPNATDVREVVITGRVLSESGGPLEAAQVFWQEGNRITTTNAGGQYTLAIPSGMRQREIMLRARRIGYAPAAVLVRLDSNAIVQDFVLAQDASRLAEVVVTGVTGGEMRTRVEPAGAGAAAAAKQPGVVLRAPADVQSRDASQRSHPLAPPPSPHERIDGQGHLRRNREPGNTETYDWFADNPFLGARSNPLSTFSIDVDRASYSNIRRFISRGQLPPRDAVRIEEMVNYFTYDLPAPDGREPLTITTELGTAPWNASHQLLRIGLQAKRIATSELPPSNLVFLIDVSGSMMPPNRLPLVKQSFRLLVNELRPQDRVAIVVYAGAAGLVLPSTPGDQKDRIMDAIERLEAGGSTAGGAGLRLAYEVAREGHIRGGNNRVILATDGDFNVGVSSEGELVRMIEERRTQGTFLTVLGYGMGNYKDSRLEKLSKHGNGNYAYIDDLMEARKVLVSEFGGTLFTVAKDVKLQIEFNPARVAGYRLIGYENRLLRSEDFNDDTKDAGEMGAGHTVTALYEIVPAGVRSSADIRDADALRYQRSDGDGRAARSDELLLVKLRYKEPDGDRSRLMEHPVRDVRSRRHSVDFTFASAVAAYGMILRDSEHRGTATLADVLELARAGRGDDRFGYRAEFVTMVQATERIVRARDDRADASRPEGRVPAVRH